MPSDLINRVGEQHLISLPNTKPEDLEKSNDDITQPSLAWQEQEKYRKLPATLWGGTLAMRAADTKYLPKWEGEERGTEYKRRKESAVLTNFYRATCEGMADQAFSELLQVGYPEGWSQADRDLFEEWWNNVDRESTSGDLYARHAAEASVAFGFDAILVDFPAGAEAQSRAEERELGLMPYFKQVSAPVLIEAQPIEIGRSLRLNRARFLDTVEVAAGQWGSKVVSRVIVLQRGPSGGFATMTVHQDDGDGKFEVASEAMFRPPDTLPAEVKSKFREIPLTGIYTGRHGLFYSLPKLYDLAEMNALHFRKKSNFDTAVEVSSVPMHAFIGFQGDELKAQEWGPWRFVAATNDQAKVEDISFRMDSANIALDDLAKLEQYMALAAMEPRTNRATGEEKSTIRLIDEAKKMSRLQAWALQWLDGLQEATTWACWWMGLGEAPKLSYKDEVFDSLRAAPKFEELLKLATVAGTLGPVWQRVLMTEAQRYGNLSDTWNLEELLEDMDGEPPIG